MSRRPPSLRARDAQDERPIDRRLLAAWKAHGERVAVRSDAGEWTGRKAARHARAVALALQAAGVRPGDTVVVWAGRELELPSTLVGVLLSGAAFACVDPTQPLPRSVAQVADLRPRALLHGAERPPSVLCSPERALLDVCDLPSPSGRLRRAQADDAPGYVVFTSGSTGRPKAALNTRAGLALQLDAWLPLVRDPCVFLAQSSPAFDMALLQLLLPCLAGGSVVLAPRAADRDPSLLCPLVDAAAVTELLLPPTAWRLLRASGWRPASPARVTFGGEPLPAHVAEDAAACGVEVWTGWGVSEAGACTTLTPWRSGEPVTLGWPVAGARVTVHATGDGGSSCDAPTPHGETGELWIGGPAVGLGYVGRPSLTQRRFVQDAAGQRWYRTGDLGHLDAQGRVVFEGRADRQLKVRGYRVESGEVEAALRQLPTVTDAAVAAPTGADGSPTLTAWVVAEGGAPDAWRDALRSQLPGWMVPSRWVTLAALPMTANGKLDLRALLDHTGDEATGEPLVGEVEARIGRAMARVLGRRQVYRDDDFFSLGGDSLRAAQLVAELRQGTGWRLSVGDLWDAPTPRSLAAAPATAAAVAAARDGDEPPTRPTPSGATEGPVTPTQRQLLWLEALQPGDPALVVEARLRLTLPHMVDASPEARHALERRIRAALEQVQQAHAGLRSTHTLERQRVHAQLPLRVHAASAAGPLPFNLEVDAPVQARVAHGDKGVTDLTLWAHHVALDGAAMGRVALSLRDALQVSLSGDDGVPSDRAEANPRPEPLTAVDLARWSATKPQGRLRAWWAEALRGVAAPGPLPARTPEVETPGTDAVTHTLSATAWSQLVDRGRSQRASPHMTLVGAWVTWVGNALDVPELVVATVAEGRSSAAQRDLVAHLAQTLAVRVPVARALDAGVAAARAATLAALDHGELPLADALDAAGLAGQDAARLCVLLQPPPPAPLRLGAGTLTLELAPAQGAAFDLGLEATPTSEGGLALHWSWRTHVVRSDDVRRVAAAFVRWLHAPHKPCPTQLPWDRETEAAALDLPGVADARTRTVVTAAGPMRQRTWWLPSVRAATGARLGPRDDLPGEAMPVWRLPAGAGRALRRLPWVAPGARTRAAPDTLADVPLAGAFAAALTPGDGAEGARRDDALRRPRGRRSPARAELVGPPLPDDPAAAVWTLGTLAEHGARRGATVNGAPAQAWLERVDALAGRLASALGDPRGVSVAPSTAARPSRPGDPVPDRARPVVAVRSAQPERLLLGLHAAWRLGAVAAPIGADRLDLGRCLSALGATALLCDEPADAHPLDAARQEEASPSPSRSPARPDAGDGGVDAPRDALRDVVRVSLTPSELDPLRQDGGVDSPRTAPAAPLALGRTAPSPDEHALYLLTSGSTGRPKVVVHSHRTVLAQLRAWSLHHGWTARDVFVNWLPVDHVAALVMFHLQPLYVGAAQHHLAPADVLAAPLTWLDALDQHAATVTWAPNFAVALLVDALRGTSRTWSLPALRAVLNGGEAIVPATARTFATALANFGAAPDALCPGWGMSETASACVVRAGSPLSALPKAGLMPLGTPIPGHAVRVVAGSGSEAEVVDPGVTGRLQVRGPGIMLGYLGQAAAQPTWFDTGDLAQVDAGELVVVGRADDTLRIHGASVAPVRIEAAAAAVAGVDATPVAAFNARREGDGAEGVAIALSSTRAGTQRATLAERVRLAVARETGVTLRWVLVLPADNLPTTGLGKVQVRALRGRFEAGALDKWVAAGTFTRNGVYTEVWRPWRQGPALGGDHVVAVLGDAREWGAVRDSLAVGRDAPDAACAQPTLLPCHPGPMGEALRAVVDGTPSAPVTVVVCAQVTSTGERDAPALCREVTQVAAALGPRGVRWLVCGDTPTAAAAAGLLGALEAEVAGTRVLWARSDADAGVGALISSRWRDARAVRATAAGWESRKLTGGPTPALNGAEGALRAQLSRARVVLVGGSGGVGQRLQAALGQVGAKVLVTSRRPASAAPAAPRRPDVLDARPTGAPDTRPTWTQVATARELAPAVARWEATLGAQATHVVLLVAGGERAPIGAMPADLSLPRGDYAAAAANLVRERDRARLIDVNSVHAALPGPLLARYGADAALSARLTETLGGDSVRLLMTGWRGVGLSAPGELSDALAAAAGLPALAPEHATAVVLNALVAGSGTWWVGLDPGHALARSLSAGDVMAAVADTSTRSGPAALSAAPDTAPHRPRAGDDPGDAQAASALPAARGRAAAHPDDVSAVRAAWAEALERDVADDESTFFEVGGHSLLLAKVRASLMRTHPVDVPMVALFTHPTVQSQARWLGQALGRPDAVDVAQADLRRRGARSDDARDPVRAGRPTATPDVGPGSPWTRGTEPIAIVGLAGRFGGCRTPQELWRLLDEGRHAMRRFSRDELLEAGLPASVVDDPRYVPVRAPLVDADRFDARLFGISPREAALTDPQHRVFLESSLAALEDAALDPGRFGGRIGVVGGCSPNTYLLNQVLRSPNAAGALGGLASVIASDKDHLATRVAWQLGLGGPALTVGTACSTSLVAVHMACQILRSGEADVMLAGGASVAVPLVAGHVFNGPGIASSDGLTRSFSADGEGPAGGDAVGVVVLRRLSDAVADGDPIRAVIVGSATTNDGRERVGYTAPGVDGQARAVRQALAQAGLSPDDLDLIEAHGTATPVGDPIEVAALATALRGRASTLPPVWLGSVKSNLGHTNAAAGVTGLIKATLALEHERVPATLHVTTVNPGLRLDETPLQVAVDAVPWPRGARRRRAGVSSFGAGGTNAHVIVAESPATEGRRPAAAQGRPVRASGAPLLLQAGDAAGLRRVQRSLLAWWQDNPSVPLADVSHTLATGRMRRAHRAVWWADDAGAPWRTLEGPPLAAEPRWRNGDSPDATVATRSRVPATPAQTVFVVPGQGLQRVGAGATALRRNAPFAAAFEQANAASLAAGGPDLRPFLLGDPGDDTLQTRLDDQRNAGPHTLALGWAVGRALQAAGLAPDVLMGQSTGEFAAAALAGVMSLSDAMRFMVARAELLATTPPGAVVAVALPADALQRRLVDDTWLALRNGPNASVAAGTPEGADALCAALRADEVPHQRLRVSVAAHTPLIAAIEEPLLALARSFELSPPQVAMVSAVTGEALTTDALRSPRYWARHAIEPVNVVGAFATLRGWGEPVFVELGPERCMASLCRWNAPDAAHVAPLASDVADHRGAAGAPRRRVDPILRAAALATCHGAHLGAPHGTADPTSGPRRVHLPTYPFARDRHWVDAEPAAADAIAPLSLSMASAPAPLAPTASHARPGLGVDYRAPATSAERSLVAMCEALLGVEGIGVDDDFFALGGDSLVTMRLIAEIRRVHGVELPPSAAFDGFSVARLASYLPSDIDPAAPDGHAAEAPTPSDADTVPRPPQPGPTASSLPRCLVPLRRSGTRAPLFFVHPAAGVVFPYVELARTLDPDRPFWGLQAAGLDGQEAPDLDVPAMARRYVRALRQVQPTGPYHLGAFSFGCYIAFEMALQLDDAGESVGLLALVDEAAPLDGHRPSPAMMSRILFGRAGKTFLHHLHDYAFLRDANRRARGDKGTVSRLLGPRGQRTLRQLLQRSTMAALLPDDTHEIALDQGAMSPMFRLLAIHLRETLSYTPSRALPIKATLLTSQWATDRPFWIRGDPDPTFGWSKLAQHGVDIRRLTGDHLALIRHPHVKRLASELESALGEAESR